MKAGDVIEQWRRLVFDTEKPYLWGEDEALLYLNEAYREWVRLIGGIRDSTSDLTYVTVPSGIDVIPLDERVVKIISARRVDTGRPLGLYGPNSDEAIDPPRTGLFHGFVLGEDDTSIRPVYTPTEEYQVRLVIDRLPLASIDDDEDELEIREEHKLKLVVGMMSHCYRKDDIDTYDVRKADANAELFRAEAKIAYLERRRRYGSARTVRYGGL